MNRFHRELSDLTITTDTSLDINISTFDTFADYFFDGLIFDWMVQSKINKSLIDTEKTSKNISKILRTLKYQLINVENEIVDTGYI